MGATNGAPNKPEPKKGDVALTRSAGRRLARMKEHLFHLLLLAATLAGLLTLAVLFIDVLIDGATHLNWGFLTNFPSRFPEKAGLYSAIMGTVWLVVLVILIAFPLGVGAAVYLEEFAPRNRITRLLEANISNLAGVPSIVYGILGLALFVRFMGLGRSILAGALTISLLILPVIIITAREALKAVPKDIRLAGLALGATKWEVVRSQVLPVAFPGILTGFILSLSRAVGESAPLIMIGALAFVAFTPSSPLDSFTVLPIQIFNWIGRPQEEFHALAAAGIIVMLAVLITVNLVSVLLRNRFTRKW